MIRALLVDDERSALASLGNALNEECQEVVVVGTAENVTEAFEKIQRLNPDVLFLDVEMPHENGFNLLEKFDNYGFAVIFVTAYDEYAIRAIRFSAMDYLLKPVDRKELREAVERLKRARPEQIDSLVQTLKEGKVNRITFNDNERVFVREIKEIVRFQADRNYTEVFFTDGAKIVMSKTLKFYEDLLEGEGFVRCHRSHLVAMNTITELDKHSWVFHLRDGSKIPISTRKKSEVLRCYMAYK